MTSVQITVGQGDAECECSGFGRPEVIDAADRQNAGGSPPLGVGNIQVVERVERRKGGGDHVVGTQQQAADTARDCDRCRSPNTRRRRPGNAGR